MALLTDDCDIVTNYLRTYLGGNGDYYIEIIDVDQNGIKHPHCVRVLTSGGFAKTDVKIAVANLYQAMEKDGLNEYPDE